MAKKHDLAEIITFATIKGMELNESVLYTYSVEINNVSPFTNPLEKKTLYSILESKIVLIRIATRCVEARIIAKKDILISNKIRYKTLNIDIIFPGYEFVTIPIPPTSDRIYLKNASLTDLHRELFEY